MAAGTWTITELRRGAQGGSEGEVFVWTADMTPPRPEGGARAAPRVPWSFGGMQRTKRVDYTGATEPSVQVLGPVHKPQVLTGTFDDRYNFAGYAVEETRRLESMCKRGNPIRLQFQDQVFTGMITDWDFPYRRAWQISYSLSIDIYTRPEERREREPDVEMAPGTAFDAVDLAVQAALEFDLTAPRSVLQGNLSAAVAGRLAAMTVAVDGIGATLDAATGPSPSDVFARLASKFRELQGASYLTLLELGAVRSDVALAVQTPMGVLDFEEWTRSVRWAARIAMGRAFDGDRACSARSEPNAVRLYRPNEGESLYSISRKFYGTPHAWRLIYDRNQLTSGRLTGEEILIIPERGSV